MQGSQGCCRDDMRDRKKTAWRCALLALLLMGMLLPAASAQSSNPNAAFCSGLIAQPSASSPAVQFLSNFKGLTEIAVLIMSVMIGIAAMAYAIGYAFRIDRLVAFSKSEIAEIIITLIVVAIFLGSIYAINFSGLINIGPQNSYTVFNADCEVLSYSSVSIFHTIAWVFIPENYLMQLIYNTEIDLKPVNFGPFFEPFHGFEMLNNITITLMNFSGGLAVVFLALSVFLAIIYVLFPIFFFLGIVLRTVPFTRAAGGAFLGLFIGFYVLFPLMLYLLLSTGCATLSSSQQSCTLVASPTGPVISGSSILGSLSSLTNPSSAEQGVSSLGSAVGQLATEAVVPGEPALNLITNANPNSAYDFLDPAFIIGIFITLVVEPQIFAIFALVISLMVSLNFTELVGDFLGSESLSSRGALRRIL